MTWLSQKPETEPTRPTPPAPPVARKAEPAPFPEPRREKAESPNVASIGKSLHIKGELTGHEDLVIDGVVEGRVSLKGCSVTIGPNGRVQAEIEAKSVVVGGQLHGNVVAEAKVEITATGTMVGDVHAPRVALADGASFKGSIDMDPKPASARPAADPIGSHVPTPVYAGATDL